jgi:hypothetical protein
MNTRVRVLVHEHKVVVDQHFGWQHIVEAGDILQAQLVHLCDEPNVVNHLFKRRPLYLIMIAGRSRASLDHCLSQLRWINTQTCMA